ncbi:hypothetical protein EDM56_06810 [Brevibacillus fluminis]|uniref:Uncharacterized protein n=1 Tax=Brevibacillus fluminis TaxID=511487 RepID=A0A3M8DTN7_9BACL|nr:hypothetical protein [Brevibacillus fluminis]RNB91284.1 hypothetical protein EDM56_06810 [Brevibacillus fluminis]
MDPFTCSDKKEIENAIAVSKVEEMIDSADRHDEERRGIEAKIIENEINSYNRFESLYRERHRDEAGEGEREGYRGVEGDRERGRDDERYRDVEGDPDRGGYRDYDRYQGENDSNADVAGYRDHGGYRDREDRRDEEETEYR